MNKHSKERTEYLGQYVVPDIKVIEIQASRVICISGDSIEQYDWDDESGNEFYN